MVEMIDTTAKMIRIVISTYMLVTPKNAPRRGRVGYLINLIAASHALATLVTSNDALSAFWHALITAFK